MAAILKYSTVYTVMVHRRIDTDATDKRGLPGGWANGISEAGDRTVASTEKQVVVPNFSDLTLWEQLPLELSRGGAGA